MKKFIVLTLLAALSLTSVSYAMPEACIVMQEDGYVSCPNCGNHVGNTYNTKNGVYQCAHCGLSWVRGEGSKVVVIKPADPDKPDPGTPTDPAQKP